MIKKPIQKISYLYDQSTFVEHREYFLKEEFDYPILDRPCPEYIPEKLNLIASKKGELVHDFMDDKTSRFECRIETGAPGIFYFALKPGKIITELMVNPKEVLGEITCYLDDRDGLVYSFYNISKSLDAIFISGIMADDTQGFSKIMRKDPHSQKIKNELMAYSIATPEDQATSPREVQNKNELIPVIKKTADRKKNLYIIGTQEPYLIPNREFDFLYLLCYRYINNHENNFINSDEDISSDELKSMYGMASNIRESEYKWCTDGDYKRKSYDILKKTLKDDIPIVYGNLNFQIDPSIEIQNLSLKPY